MLASALSLPSSAPTAANMLTRPNGRISACRHPGIRMYTFNDDHGRQYLQHAHLEVDGGFVIKGRITLVLHNENGVEVRHAVQRREVVVDHGAGRHEPAFQRACGANRVRCTSRHAEKDGHKKIKVKRTIHGDVQPDAVRHGVHNRILGLAGCARRPGTE